MRKVLLIGMAGLLVLLYPLWASGQVPEIVFKECVVLSDGVLYHFWACAGPDVVNDIEVYIYDVDGNAVDILSISAPPSWTPHATGNCGYWSTVDNPILPGECLDEFDFKVPPDYCDVLVHWQFTLDGNPVASGHVYFTCSYTAAEEHTWGSIKSLYR
jgi:hypothetical protein